MKINKYQNPTERSQKQKTGNWYP